MQQSLSVFAPDSEAEAVASEPEADWQAFQCEQPVDEQEETEQPVPKRRAVMRLSSPYPIDPNRAGPSGWHQPPESSESRASEIRRILYSSDEEEEAEAKSALLIARAGCRSPARKETRDSSSSAPVHRLDGG